MGGGRRLRKVIAISRRSANLAVPDVCSEQTNIPPTCDGRAPMDAQPIGNAVIGRNARTCRPHSCHQRITRMRMRASTTTEAHEW